MTHKSEEKSSLAVLEISKLQFFFSCNFFYYLVIETLDLDSDPDPH
jgi:hypothetical protein